MQLQLQITQMQSIQTRTAGQTPCVYPYSLITTQPNIFYVYLYFSFFLIQRGLGNVSLIFKYLYIHARYISTELNTHLDRSSSVCTVYIYLQSEPPTKMVK